MTDPAPTSRPVLAPGIAANLRYDLPAGLVVFLVALPLCLGIALASDAPPIAGVISGVVAGLLVAPLSGSALSVSGPAAGLTVLVASSVDELGSFEAVLPAIMLAGAMQFAAGLARAGVLANLFPASVIEGMLAGIGITLVLKQIPHALGRDEEYVGALDFSVFGHQADTFSAVEAAVATASPGIALLTLACLAVLALWRRPFIARRGWSTLISGPLMAVAVGVAINELYGLLLPAWQATGDQLVRLPVADGPRDLFASLPTPDWRHLGSATTWRIAATIAVVASLETLLSVEAADKLDPFHRTSDPDRELLAQGVGNLTAGALGGLPMTAVIVRSSANIYAGGRTRAAGFIHGVLLLVLVATIPLLLNRIPVAALAAILLTVGYQLARAQLFRKMYHSGGDQFVPFLTTLLVTVLHDLLVGVFAGLLVGLALVLYTNFPSAITVVSEGDLFLIRFGSDVTFLNKVRLRRVLAALPDGAHVIIDGARADFIDHDVRELIHSFEQGARHRRITVEVRMLESKLHPLRLPGSHG